jgi:hypothetical protein
VTGRDAEKESPLWTNPDVIHEMRRYKTVDAIPVNHGGLPYIVESVPALTELSDQHRAVSTMSIFASQVAKEKVCISGLKAQCPINPGLAADLSPALASVVPHRLKMHPQTDVLVWGALPTLKGVSFEYGSIGNVRYQTRGTREVIILNYATAFKWMEEVNKAEYEDPTKYTRTPFTSDDTPLIRFQKFFSSLSDESLAVIKQTGTTGYRATQTAGFGPRR